MNKTEESDKRWEGGGKICLKAYQKSGVTVILFTVRGCSKLKRPIESSTVGAGFACPMNHVAGFVHFFKSFG